MPKFSNEDNFIMIIKLNNDAIRDDKLVAYFLAAPKDTKSYLFKNKFKYKVVDETLFAKAKNPKLMLYKENGVRVSYRKLKDSTLQFRHFSIAMNEEKNEKKAGFLKKLFKSFSGSSNRDFARVSTFNSLYEFDKIDSQHKFNKTRFDTTP